jgi:hypothetical protein
MALAKTMYHWFTPPTVPCIEKHMWCHGPPVYQKPTVSV